MADFGVVEILAVLVGGMLSAMALLAALAWLDRRRALPGLGIAGSDRQAVVFLFDDEHLVDATPGGHQLLAASGQGESSWARFVSAVLPSFPNIAREMEQLTDRGFVDLLSRDGRARLRAEWVNSLARIRLMDVDREDTAVSVDKHALKATEQELGALRALAEHVPFPIWKETVAGEIVWVNRAYLDLAENQSARPRVDVWPPQRVFPMVGPAETAGGKPQRFALAAPGSGDARWFEVTATSLPDGLLMVACDVGRLVKAETGLREFVQTLTKTFAHLTVGLAIFDKSRKLALFNPALTDLTRLPVDFLSARPTLLMVLDRLRETRVMPEPKNYQSWRQEISVLESAAAEGTYQELWTLPSGQTYRVSGRPHPDGAIAFLFEDITAEISLTRRFRQQIELGQAVLDGLDEAVVVFNEIGQQSLSNAAYARLWSLPGGEGLMASVEDAVSLWEGALQEGPATEALKSAALGEKGPLWTGHVVPVSGPALDVQARALPGGARSLAFRPAPPPLVLSSSERR